MSKGAKKQKRAPKRARKAPRHHASKSGLAAILRWSMPKLDRRVLADPQFPIHQRGGIGKQWMFDAKAVQEYLKRVPTFGDDEDEQGGGQDSSAKQRRDMAQAMMFEDRVRQRRAELVEREDVRMTISTMSAKLGAALDSLPEQLGQACKLTEDVVERLRVQCDAMRTEMVNELKALLA